MGWVYFSNPFAGISFCSQYEWLFHATSVGLSVVSLHGIAFWSWTHGHSVTIEKVWMPEVILPWILLCKLLWWLCIQWSSGWFPHWNHHTFAPPATVSLIGITFAEHNSQCWLMQFYDRLSHTSSSISLSRLFGTVNFKMWRRSTSSWHFLHFLPRHVSHTFSLGYSTQNGCRSQNLEYHSFPNLDSKFTCRFFRVSRR